MHSDVVKEKLFTRRTFALIGIKITVLCFLISRLYYLQIIKSSKYKTLSDSNRIRFSIIPPLRGNILDRTGREMANNTNYYRILLDPWRGSNLKDTVMRLSNLLALDYKQQQNFVEHAMSKKSSNSTVILYDHLSWKQVATIEANAIDLPGISIEEAQIRSYPYKAVTSHFIGYVSKPSKQDTKLFDDKTPLFKHPDFKVGKNGIERIYENHLRGKAGVKQIEVNAYGRLVRELSKQESKSGNDLNLTIDLELQKYVMSILPNKGSSAVVLDVRNGNVLALCSAPAFDANLFSYGLSSKEWNNLNNNPYKPLLNRTISERYPPGSTFKIIVALAMLKEGISPHQHVFCPGHYRLGNRVFHCWKKGGHGSMDMRNAIKNSCNTYFYTLSQKVGVDKIAAMARIFGLGEKTNIGLPNEIDGLIPSREWKKKRYKESWQKGDTLNMSIGQGFVESTPLQLAMMIARLASYGQDITPNILADKTKEFKSLGINPDHMKLVMEGMYKVMNEIGGTAFGSRIRQKDFKLAGKTGTSQVVKRSVNLDKEDDEIAWKNKNHALFVGFAPTHNPRYAISVIVEHGGGGSKAAAPLAKKIILKAQELDI